jgi:hypothetical protein
MRAGRLWNALEDSNARWKLRRNPGIFGVSLQGSERRSEILRASGAFGSALPDSERRPKIPWHNRRLCEAFEDSAARPNLLRGDPDLCEAPDPPVRRFGFLRGEEGLSKPFEDSEADPEIRRATRSIEGGLHDSEPQPKNLQGAGSIGEPRKRSVTLRGLLLLESSRRRFPAPEGPRNTAWRFNAREASPKSSKSRRDARSMIYTHVLNRGGRRGVQSPLDSL